MTHQWLLKVALILSAALWTASGFAQARRTAFKESHGFHFSNSFQNYDDLPAGLDLRSAGLCGGMTYAAFDYYVAGLPVPEQWYRPAEGSTLQQYLYDRQRTSVWSNVDKWTEVIVNPFGLRSTEFFEWGLRGSNGGRIEELRSFIDRGMPVPLGMKGWSDNGVVTVSHTADHQVLAVGYDMGRYRGDLGNHKEDFKIFVLDPNYPRQIRTLIPYVAGEFYTYAEDWGEDRYQTYFVDKNYSFKRPPAIPNRAYPDNDLIYEIVLEIRTGDDDLRGGNDNINLTFTTGSPVAGSVSFSDINRGARWISNYTQYVPLVLPKAVRREDLHSITLDDTFGGGFAGDNWDMQFLQVHAVAGDRGGAGSKHWPILKPRAGFRRFTGQDDPHRIVLDTNYLDGVAKATDRFGTAVASADFNGDGFMDLAVGSSLENAESGTVIVVHGSHSGLTGRASRAVTQETLGGASEAGDHFGESLAVGDFNDDGYDDLAIGAPNEVVGTTAGAGAVFVMHGSSRGLKAAPTSLWHQNVAGIEGSLQVGDAFGFSLASADFDGDGHDDLAVGVYGEDVGNTITDAGMVNVLYGGASGLAAAGNQRFHQDTPGIGGNAEPGDRFGWALAAGDLDDDGYADLAVGAPGEAVGTNIQAGAVNVIFGSNSGLRSAGNRLLYQGVAGVEGVAEAGDEFGQTLVIGDFDRSGHADLAVGVPREDIDSIVDAGAVNLIYSSGGLRTADNQIWYQGNGMAGEPEARDMLGRGLAAGDFNGDGSTDLAIGSREGVGEASNAGAVNVLYGTVRGLASTGNQLWHQDVAGMTEMAEQGDLFGRALAVGDFDNDQFDDLAIGVPQEDVVEIDGLSVTITQDAGALSVLYGNTRTEGLQALNNRLFHQ